MKIHLIKFSKASCLLLSLLMIGMSAPVAEAHIDPAAAALAKEVAAKISSAQTIRLSATHKLDPALGVGARLERGPFQITVQRPNHFYVLQSAGDETREVAFDGKTLCLMQPAVKIHALESLKAGSIDQLADTMDNRFGFRPPVAELLSADFSGQLFLNVTSAKVVGTEWIGLTRCERLHFEQEGMTGDLWVGKKDKLPRRYLLTFTDVSGQPTWDIKLAKWELNVPVDAALFTKRPAADSQKVKMLKSR